MNDRQDREECEAPTKHGHDLILRRCFNGSMGHVKKLGTSLMGTTRKSVD